MDFFHVLNRGVDRRQIFLEDKDYLRFIHNLYEFNDADPVVANNYYFNQSSVIARPKVRKERKLLVAIHAFCLMPNHYHLLLSPKVDNGIAKFMKKLNMGYARYFNEKYNRVGALFQGRYKKVKVENEAHFLHLPYYIHLNPLDLVAKEWREGKILNYEKAIAYLVSYRWSSFRDYIGISNFSSVTSRSFILDLFGNAEELKRRTFGWLSDMGMEIVKDVALE